MEDRIKGIIERWFIQEPAMFQVICTHELVENRNMECPLRSGRKRIEYNPDYIAQMTDAGLDEALQTEACRSCSSTPTSASLTDAPSRRSPSGRTS